MSAIWNSIKQFTIDGMWTHRQAMINITLGVPIAIEACILGKKLFEHRKEIKAEVIKVKNLVVDSFSRRENETPEEARARILKNVAKVFAVAVLVGAAVFAPFIVLPTYLAIPYAIAAIGLIGKALVHHKEIEQKFSHAVTVIKNAFTVQPGESPEEARRRIAINAVKLAAAVIVVSGVIAASIYLIETGAAASAFSSFVQFCVNSPIGVAIQKMISQFGSSGWFSFPQPSELMAYVLYGVVSLGHFCAAIYNFRKGNKMRGIYHILGGLAGIAFPLTFLIQGQSFRLHHSFYGLIAMLVPFRSFNFFGTLMTADSFLYFFEPQRGYVTQESWGDLFHTYDYSNVFVDNFILFLGVFVAVAAFQLLIDRLFSTKKEKPGEDSPEKPMTYQERLGKLHALSDKEFLPEYLSFRTELINTMKKSPLKEDESEIRLRLSFLELEYYFRKSGALSNQRDILKQEQLENCS